MRILWLSGNPALYKKRIMIDGGWIGTLQEEIVKKGIKLAIAFPYLAADEPSEGDGVMYYPMYISKRKKILNRFRRKKIDEHYINLILRIIDDFKPDIIHCWGSELCYGLIGKYTKIPVIMHIQGIINPIYDAYLPVGMSGYSILKSVNFNLYKFYKTYLGALSMMRFQARRELEIFKNIHYFFGRTLWDKNLTNFLSPNPEYFYCSEALRTAITQSSKWHSHHERDKMRIATTISFPLYKGADVILKAAKYLKNIGKFDFEWNVYGIDEMKLQERFTGIQCSDVNVFCVGKVNAETLANGLLDSDVYVHPSYIDNSPNSVCEAQYLGVPVIAVNVGGVSSLFEENSGILIPANDPYQMAFYIKKLCNDEIMSNTISANEISLAEKRHNSDEIIDNILSCYTKILLEQNER